MTFTMPTAAPSASTTLAASGLPDLKQAGAFLDQLLAGLYTHSSGAAPPLQIPIIVDPLLARQILSHPDIFVKNYAFLEDLARGRFSGNGQPWRQRANLSRAWYLNAHKKHDPDLVKAIYRLHLARSSDVLSANELLGCFNLAAVEMFSHALNLPHSLPWPTETVGHLRAMLNLRQWASWNGCSARQMQLVQAELIKIREQVRELWQRDPSVAALLATLQADGKHIEGFDATEELLQNVLASSEATACGLMWIAEALAQQPDMQRYLAQDTLMLDRFIAETLRMFPPVPFLTRLCTANHTTDDGQVWRAGSVLSISIVGMHRHPDYWCRPGEFDMMRPEFEGNRPPIAYIPFSRGERVCAGMGLAQLEMRAAVEMLLSLRECRPGTTPTGFGYGLASFPRTSLTAHRR